MKFQCQNCREIIEADNALSGKNLKCGVCGGTTAVPADRLASGAVIGDFLIQRELARGGMGMVYLAHQISLDRPAALKVLSKAHAGNAEYIVAFVREARLAAKLNHPNIVQAYAVGEDDGLFYFAMEYIDGKTMKQVLSEEVKLPVSQAFSIVEQVAEALNYAWKECGMIHRDIKPDNIMLASDGRVKLADLGLARDYRGGLEEKNEVFGTPQYIAPERFSGKEIDNRSDIYSLGATFYQFVTGRFPFPGRTADEVAARHIRDEAIAPDLLNPAIPKQVSDMIMRMLAKRPADRYQDAEELLQDLRNLRKGKVLETFERKVKIDTLSVKPVTVRIPINRTANRTKTIQLTGTYRTSGKPDDLENIKDSAERLDKMKRLREARAKTIVLLIILSLAVLVTAAVLFIRWLVYVPQMNSRELERNIAQMKERAAKQRMAGAEYHPLDKDDPDLMRRGVIESCSNEDYLSALLLLGNYRRDHRFPKEEGDRINGMILRARDFSKLIHNGGTRCAGIRLSTEEHGIFEVEQVRNSVLSGKGKKEVRLPLAELSAQEYKAYLTGIASKYSMSIDLGAYLLCAGDFNGAMALAVTNREKDFVSRMAYAYIRGGLVGASPMEIKRLRMLYGGLDAYRSAASKESFKPKSGEKNK